MGRVRMISAFAAAACALAVAAVPAGAHQFTASRVNGTFPLKVKGVGDGPQTFKFGKIEVECGEEKSNGTIAESPADVLKIDATYKECTVPVTVFGQHKTLTTHLKVEYLYHANGYVQSGSEGNEVEIGPGDVSINIPHTGGCKILWPSQTIPLKAETNPDAEYAAALFSNAETPQTRLKLFPDGFQHTLTIANEFKGMLFSVEEKGLCEEYEPAEGRNGRYSGALSLEVPSGDLSYE